MILQGGGRFCREGGTGHGPRGTAHGARRPTHGARPPTHGAGPSLRPPADSFVQLRGLFEEKIPHINRTRRMAVTPTFSVVRKHVRSGLHDSAGLSCKLRVICNCQLFFVPESNCLGPRSSPFYELILQQVHFSMADQAEL